MDGFISRTQRIRFAMALSILLVTLPRAAHARSSGGAGDALAVAPKGMAFPDKVFGVSGETSWPKRLKISVSQKSDRPLRIESISIGGANGADFAVHQLANCVDATLTTGCAVTVTFTPKGLGMRTATLTVTDTSGFSAEQVALTGRGIKGSLKWEPREISFGKVRPGASSAPVPVSITNPNAAPLSITGISVDSGDFIATQTQTCVGKLAPHSSCRFYVAANPPSAAAKSRKDSIRAKLEIQDAAAGNPHNVMLSALLSGSAVPPPTPLAATLTHAILVTNTPCNNVTSYPIGASGNAAPTFPQPQLCTPTGIALDASKNIYVTNSGDDGNQSYSVTEYPAGSNGQIPPSAVISGSATGLDVPAGVALDSSGKIYVVNDGSNDDGIDSVTVYPAGSTGNAAPSATISGANTRISIPAGIAIDSAGKIYVANGGNNTVSVYAAGSTGNVAPSATIRGFSTGLAGPTDIALDSGGKIYVANGGNNTVTVYPAGSSGNAAPSATISGSNTGLSDPTGVALGSGGKIYVANGYNGAEDVTVYPAGSNGNVAPSATIIGAAPNAPAAIAIDSAGKIYVANDGSQNGGPDTVTVYPAGSNGYTVPGAIINGAFALSLTGLNNPRAVAVDSAGKIYVVNNGFEEDIASSVTVYPAGSNGNAAPIATISGSNTGLFDPAGIAVDSSGKIYVADTGGGESDGSGSAIGPSVFIYAAGSTGNVAPSATISGSSTGLGCPAGVALDSGSKIYVVDACTEDVTVYPKGSNGDVVPSATIFTGLFEPTGIALDTAANIYVVNVGGFSGSGSGSGSSSSPESVTVYPKGSSGEATPSARISGPLTALDNPTGIAVDSAGKIYVTNDGSQNGGSDSVTVYSAGSNGNIAPSATVGGPLTALYVPTGVAVDSAKKIYATNSPSQNSGLDRVTVYPAGSTANALPSAEIGFLPNNGMDEPAGIALDGAGNIYVTNLNSFALNFNQGINPVIYAAGSGATGVQLLNNNANILPYSSLPSGIALDSGQNVYIVSAKPSEVDIFSPLNAGLSPLGTLDGDTTQMSYPAGIALDASGNIYVTNDASDGLGDRVTIYPPESGANQAPSAVIMGSNTGLAFPAGIAVDSSGNIYVANMATDAVTVYAPGSNGNVAPSKTISGSSTGLDTPSAIAIDSSGLIYVANEGGFEGDNVSVTVYAAGSSGNVTPVTTISGSATQLARPRGIAIIP
jgi:DNA-binding beta-propeller fold protein YncE